MPTVDAPDFRNAALNVTGVINIDAFSNIARFGGPGGDSLSSLSSLGPNVFLGNLYNFTAPARAFNAEEVAGDHIVYNFGRKNGPFPVVLSAAAQSNATSATSHTVTMPDGVKVRDRIIVAIWANGTSQAVTTPTNWTLVATGPLSSGVAVVFERFIDGSANDPVATLPITFAVSSSLLAYVWHVSQSGDTVPCESAIQLVTSPGTSNDPASVTPTWGNSNTLYLMFLATDVEDASPPNVTVFPTDFTGTGELQLTSILGSVDGAIAWGQRNSRGTTLDPTAFTHVSARSASILIAVPPEVSGALDWEGLDVRKNSTGGVFTRRRLNLIEGTGITLTVADDAGNDEVDITVAASGGAGSQGWDDVLGIDPHSDGHNPIVNDADFMQFGLSVVTLPVTGQIRTDENFELRGSLDVQIRAGEAATLLGFDTTTVRSIGGIVQITSDGSGVFVDADTDFDVDAGDDVNLTAIAGDVLLNATAGNFAGVFNTNASWTVGSFFSVSAASALIDTAGLLDLEGATIQLRSLSNPVNITQGFLNFVEQAASTPTVGAGSGLFWVRSDTPNVPMFTDDTNVDHRLAYAPLPLTDLATQAAGTVLANVTAGVATPTAHALTTLAGNALVYTNVTGIIDVVPGAGASLVVGASDIQRGALTGAITAAQDSNTTAFGTAAAKAVLANATNATAVPAYLAGTAAFQHLRVNSANTGLEWSVLTTGDFPANSVPLSAFPTQAAGTVLANITAGTAVPTAHTLSTLAGGGLVYTNVTGVIDVVAGGGASLVVGASDIQRGALTGAITAAQDSNTTAFGVLAAKSVLANATNASAVPAALAGSAAFQHLRVNSANTALEWSVLTTGDFPANSVPLSAFPTQAAGTLLANITAGVAVPTAHTLTTLAGAGLVYTNVTGVIDVVAGAGASLVVGAGDIQRGALTGAVTAAQDSNTTAFGTAAAKSVLANATNATAVPAFLAGTAAFQHLRVNSANTGLEWSLLTAAEFPTAVVPIASLETIATNTVLANATAGTASATAVAVAAESVFGRTSGNITAITSAVQSALIRGAGSVFWGAAAADQVLRRSGAGDLGFGTLVTNNIGTNQVTMARIEQVGSATFLGRVTAGTGNVEILTSTQATANLNVFTTSLNGLVPGSGGGTTNFLRADGTFAAPATGAGTGLQFVTFGAEATLSNERVTTASTSITINTGVASQIAFERAALTGDVTAGANSNATTIANNAVTIAKMQQVATDTFLGRDTAGTGNVEVLTATQAGNIINDTWSAVLTRGATSGAHNPIVDTSQFLGFGASGLPGSGQIRSAASFTMNIAELQFLCATGNHIAVTAGGIGAGLEIEFSTTAPSTLAGTSGAIWAEDDLRLNRILPTWSDGSSSGVDGSQYNLARYRDEQKCFIHDDFTFVSINAAAVTTTAQVLVADTGWSAQTIGANGSITQVFAGGHPGVMRMTSGATSGNAILMYKGLLGFPTGGWVAGNEILIARVVARISTTSTVFCEIGFTVNPGGTPTDALEFYFDTNVGTTVHVFCREASGTAVDINTGVTPGSGFNKYEIYQNATGTFTFFIDDALVHTESGQAPDTEQLNFAILVGTRTSAARTIDVDLFEFESRVLTARNT